MTQTKIAIGYTKLIFVIPTMTTIYYLAYYSQLDGNVCVKDEVML